MRGSILPWDACPHAREQSSILAVGVVPSKLAPSSARYEPRIIVQATATVRPSDYLIPSELSFVTGAISWFDVIPLDSSVEKHAEKISNKLTFSGEGCGQEDNDPTANELAFLGCVHLGGALDLGIYTVEVSPPLLMGESWRVIPGQRGKTWIASCSTLSDPQFARRLYTNSVLSQANAFFLRSLDSIVVFPFLL
jgi:hypothetical protein